MNDEGAISVLTEMLERAIARVPDLSNQTNASDKAMATSDDLTDSKIAASEARSETKMARLEGKMDLVLQKLDDRKGDAASVKANLWVATGLVIAVLAMLTALAPTLFSIGTSMRDLVRDEVRQAKP